MLYSAVHDRLEARFEIILPLHDASPKSTLLKLENVDLASISSGGPTIMVVHAQLEHPGKPLEQFRALRQGNMKPSEITTETTECSMIDPVIDALAYDIAQWMLSYYFHETQ